MNKWKILAIIFTVLTLGSIQETTRIFTSDAPDIADNRPELMPMGIIITLVFLFLAIRFWRRSSTNK